MLIALTGGIGSGKSVVSQLLRVLGHPVFDCDARAKWAMTHDPQLRRQLIALFGPDTYQGETLDRAYLSSRIFSDPEALSQMNACVHPAVGRDLQRQYAAMPQRPFFFESAILFESGFDRISCPDQVWTISAPLELRIARAMQRDLASRQQVLARIHAQLPQEEKEKRSDAVIHNDSEHSIIEQVLRLLQGLNNEQPC